MTKVKICGIREKEHALAAAEAGSHFIGMVFAPSPRRIEPEQAEEIANIIKGHGAAISLVGVFVNMPARQVNMVAGSYHLDWVQLSGDEPWDYCRFIAKPVIKAIGIKQGQSAEEILSELETGERILSSQQHLYLLDSRVEGKYGGTGTTLDWELVRKIAERFPIVLAGGLTPENVAQAIEEVAPWGVDVSSGVETNGVKDIAKIKAFIEAVRKADETKKQAVT